ncbi:pre-rRNA-processing protein ESF1-like [Hordeum vulgare subsp. vulgare]|uniref:pre-rRNA-processing protein ESF1-like n=1 Tax=Hordeum vulgare subsp. vulgare TaxID=112509 RepID=UPI001D1A335E|nr:pre-rRNA-processing protein ESF1-like [Hordeum vulgare subsp. vulgare]
MEGERYATERTDLTFRPMRRKEALDSKSKMKRAMEDERFTAARYRPMRRKEAKLALDSRFMTPMLTDPMFGSSEAPVDKRGRRRKKSARDRENTMPHYYLNQEDGGEEKMEQEKLICQEEDHEMQEEDGLEEEESSTSDDEEDDDDGQYSVGCDIVHYLMARHDDTHVIDKETHRLAVVNMDWDHIKVCDLYMVMTSCIPKGGRVQSVSIYPTEFGLKCMNIETIQGPSSLIGAECDGSDEDGGEDDNNDDEDDDEKQDGDLDSKTENSKLRTYELNKLRYYYAVVECDSSATANHLYTTLDGTEFLKTGNVFDLQFIYDSREFKYPARDVATEAPLSYKAPDFETPALQRAKVKPTWDDDEPGRKILRQKFKDKRGESLFRYGFDKYIASGEGASEDDKHDSGDESLPNGVAKRRLTNEERLDCLLQGNKSDEEQTDDQDMEITFNIELEDLNKRMLERNSIETKTVWEMHQEEMKEKRKARKRWSKDDGGYSDQDRADDFLDDEKSDEEVKPMKKPKVKAKGKGKDKSREEHYEPEATKEELELLVAVGQDAANGAKGYNIKCKSKKGKDSVEDKLGEIDVSKDERFSPMFTSHLYALHPSPTDPRYKRSVRKQAGKKSGHVGTLDSEAPVEPPDDASLPNKASRKRDAEDLQMLSAVNSLKRNLVAFVHSKEQARV